MTEPSETEPNNRISGKLSPPPPRGGHKNIKISEAQYLRFVLTQANEELIKTQKAKLDSDEKTLEVSRENLVLQTALHTQEKRKLFVKLGINHGDKVIQGGPGEYIIAKPSNPGDNGKE
jgi:hypothetical protein